MQSLRQIDADHSTDVFHELARRQVFNALKHEVTGGPVSFPVAAVTGPEELKRPVTALKVPLTLTVTSPDGS